MAETSATSSPSVIAVTWPHKFLEPASGGHDHYQTPCGSNELKRPDVAALVVLLPLLEMQSAGELEFEAKKSKKLFLTFYEMKLRLLGSPAAVGIKGALVQQMARHNDVRNVVRHWLGRDSNNPQNEVIGRAMLEGESLGVYKRVDANRNFVAAAFKGNTTLQCDCGQVGLLEAQADQLAVAWRALGADTIANATAAARDAIEAMRDRSDNT